MRANLNLYFTLFFFSFEKMEEAYIDYLRGNEFCKIILVFMVAQNV